MITTLMLAALQAAATPPVPPTPPSEPKKVVREIVIREHADGTVTTERHGEGEVRRNVIVLRDGKDLPKDSERKVIRMHRMDGAGAHMAMLTDCDSGHKFQTEAEGTKDGKKSRTRIVLCSKGEKSDAKYSEALENAAKRIADDKDMPADVRTRVLTDLNAEIARLKNQK